MSDLSDALELEFGQHFTGITAMTQPAALWVALFTAAPTDAGGGTEVSGGSYARINMGVGAGNWTDVGDGSFTNANVITFVTPTADWGTVTHFALYSLVTAGTLYLHSALTVTEIITSGSPVIFPVAALTFTLD